MARSLGARTARARSGAIDARALLDEPRELELGERRRDVCRARRPAARASSSAPAGASRSRASTAAARSLTVGAALAGGTIPYASSTSSADVSAVAPSRRSAFVPARERARDLARDGEHLSPLLEREVGRDQRAAPLPRLDDDRRGARPAMMRFRAGKRHGAGSTPGAYSETIEPGRAIRRARSACAAG